MNKPKHIMVCVDCGYVAEWTDFSIVPDTLACPNCATADESLLWDVVLSEPVLKWVNSHDKLVEMLKEAKNVLNLLQYTNYSEYKIDYYCDVCGREKEDGCTDNCNAKIALDKINEALAEAEKK